MHSAVHPEIVLRSTDEIECGELYQLFVASRPDLAAAVSHWNESQQEGFLRMQFRTQLQQYRVQFPDARFSAVLLGEAVIGRLFVAPLEQEIRLVDVMLLPDYRDRGIGSALVEELLDEARSLNKPVTLSVQLDNPARQLYLRLGFRRTGESGFHQRMEWAPILEAAVK